MANSGLYDFRIMDLVGSARVPSPERNDAIPISLLEPMTPELLPLLGSDFAANSELQTSLSVATGAGFDSRNCRARRLAGSRSIDDVAVGLPGARQR